MHDAAADDDDDADASSMRARLDSCGASSPDLRSSESSAVAWAPEAASLEPSASLLRLFDILKVAKPRGERESCSNGKGRTICGETMTSVQVKVSASNCWR